MNVPPRMPSLSLLGLLLLTAASVGWTEYKPVWHPSDWYLLWAMGLGSLALGGGFVRGGRHPRWRVLLVLVLLLVGQRRSLELGLMFAAWGLGGFAP